MKTYRVLTADPPWPFGDKLPGAGRGAEKHYDVLSIAGICGFELPLLEDNALLYLWRVSSMVEEAYQVCRAWGFVPKTEIVWRKLTRTGKRHFGMGRIVRAEHETCIVAKRGKGPEIKDKSVRSTFEAMVPVGDDGKVIHSAKPPEFYAIVERLSDGPYYELFARQRRRGWTQSGRELPPR